LGDIKLGPKDKPLPHHPWTLKELVEAIVAFKQDDIKTMN
jgi:hypothetical protein